MQHGLARARPGVNPEVAVVALGNARGGQAFLRGGHPRVHLRGETSRLPVLPGEDGKVDLAARVAVARVQVPLAAPRVGASGLVGPSVLLGREAGQLTSGARALRDGRRALELRLAVRRAVAARSHDDASGLKGRATRGEKVHEFAVVAYENSDAAEALEHLTQLLASVRVKVVGRLVRHEHVGATPEGNRHLQLLALTEGELAKAPGHVVLYAEGLAEPPGLAVVVQREVGEPLGRLVGVLGHVGADEVMRDGSGVGLDEAARDLGQRGLAAAVVAQKRGPSGGEGDGDIVENGLAGRRVGVAHAGEHKLHRHLFSGEMPGGHSSRHQGFLS